MICTLKHSMRQKLEEFDLLPLTGLVKGIREPTPLFSGQHICNDIIVTRNMSDNEAVLLKHKAPSPKPHVVILHLV